jgi:protein-S-isoprenylcysteine O-methyltransferase Ste14
MQIAKSWRILLSRAPVIMPLPLAVALALIVWWFNTHLQIILPNLFRWLGLSLGLTGAAIIAVAFSQFNLHKTSPHPRDFSNNVNLIFTGIFAFSRNPIYLGMLLVLIAWAFYLQNLIALLAPVIFFLWINFWQIAVEEQHLRVQFGADYDHYCCKVRRWL